MQAIATPIYWHPRQLDKPFNNFYNNFIYIYSKIEADF